MCPMEMMMMGRGEDNIIIYRVPTTTHPAKYQLIQYSQNLTDVITVIIPIL